ncbi:hypothetical protein [Microbulbifer taiwanensis]|uniref:Uncharacterized protein n=1 Tax=Microbulbifer taiwanensis TaxID=986746 RepID=A0ABW1YTE2_9GAMM
MNKKKEYHLQQRMKILVHHLEQIKESVMEDMRPAKHLGVHAASHLAY